MTHPPAKREMLLIAAGYQRLAQHAEDQTVRKKFGRQGAAGSAPRLPNVTLHHLATYDVIKVDLLFLWPGLGRWPTAHRRERNRLVCDPLSC